LLMSVASVLGFCGSVVWAPFGIALLASPAARHALPAFGAQGPLIITIATVVFGLGALVALVLITLAPRLGPRWRFARFGADPSGPPLQLSIGPLLALIPGAALAWLVGNGPLWVLVQAAAPSAHVSLLTIVGIQSVAAVVGSVTFFLPSGLGARDGAMVALLVTIAGVPLPAAAAAAVLVRVGDPVAKGLILLLVTGIGRIPGLAPSSALPRRSIRGASQLPVSRSRLGVLSAGPSA
jgi:hypothetical protein